MDMDIKDVNSKIDCERFLLQFHSEAKQTNFANTKSSDLGEYLSSIAANSRNLGEVQPSWQVFAKIICGIGQ